MKRKRNFWEWFFEPERIDKSNDNEEYIELKAWQIILISALTVLFLFWIFYPQVNDLRLANPIWDRLNLMHNNLENDYFQNNKGIKNGDFSLGLKHWNTADGGKLFPQTKSKAALNYSDFRSAPCSMQIDSLVASNRYYYTKTKKAETIDDPYSNNDFKNWLGMLPLKTVTASLWYKGDVLTFYLQGLDSNGNWYSLGSITGRATDEWEKLEIKQKIPKEGRAICLEITLNQASGMPLPTVLIDDVAVEVQ